MKLQQTFDAAFTHAEMALCLHEFLSTFAQKKLRSEWRKKFYKAKLVQWPQKEGLVRFVGKQNILVGTNSGLQDFLNDRPEYENALLRSAISFGMAAFDKLMHEAIFKNFVHLCRDGKLDKEVDVPLSISYGIASRAGNRRGKGGKIKPRPGIEFRKQVIELLYLRSFLKPSEIEKFCSGLGLSGVWSSWGASFNPMRNGNGLKNDWTKLCRKRNHIVHECDIARTLKSRHIKFQPISATETRVALDRIKSLAHFICSKVD